MNHSCASKICLSTKRLFVGKWSSSNFVPHLENRTRHTRLTSEMYRNIPAVTANIHCLVLSAALTSIPIYSPTKQQQAQKKLANSTILGRIPVDRSTAKSPEECKIVQRPSHKNGCLFESNFQPFAFMYFCFT